MEHPDEIDSLLTSRNSLVADLSGSRIFLLRDNLPERPAAATVKFATSPQPKFNKNFEMLADDMIRGALRGYDTYILSENKAQVERLENIFHQIGRGQAVVRSLSTTLHEGFVDIRPETVSLHRPSDFRPLPALPHQRRDTGATSR